MRYYSFWASFIFLSLYFFSTGFSDFFPFSLMGFCFSLHSILFFSICVFVGFLDPKRWVCGFWRSVSIFFTLFLSFALLAFICIVRAVENLYFYVEILWSFSNFFHASLILHIFALESLVFFFFSWKKKDCHFEVDDCVPVFW